MQIVERQERTWRFPRIQVEDFLGLTLMIWAGLCVFTFGVTIVVSFFRDIAISGWEIASGVAPWYLAIMSGWVMFQYVPMFIANGRTRRDSMIEWTIFAPIFAVSGALLITIGYLLEYIVYGIAGWPRVLENDHKFASHTDVVPMFTEYLLTFLVWTAVGGFVGISFYKSDDVGWFSLLPATLLVGAVGTFTQSVIGPFSFVVDRLTGLTTSSWPIAILVGVVATLVALWGAWMVLRDMPLRNK